MTIRIHSRLLLIELNQLQNFSCSLEINEFSTPSHAQKRTRKKIFFFFCQKSVLAIDRKSIWLLSLKNKGIGQHANHGLFYFNKRSPTRITTFNNNLGLLISSFDPKQNQLNVRKIMHLLKVKRFPQTWPY